MKLMFYNDRQCNHNFHDNQQSHSRYNYHIVALFYCTINNMKQKRKFTIMKMIIIYQKGTKKRKAGDTAEKKRMNT